MVEARFRIGDWRLEMTMDEGSALRGRGPCVASPTARRRRRTITSTIPITGTRKELRLRFPLEGEPFDWFDWFDSLRSLTTGRCARSPEVTALAHGGPTCGHSSIGIWTPNLENVVFPRRFLPEQRHNPSEGNVLRTNQARASSKGRNHRWTQMDTDTGAGEGPAAAARRGRCAPLGSSA